MQLGLADVAPVDSISMGALSLDLALGVKGVPKGRIVEIYTRIIRENNTSFGISLQCTKKVAWLHLLMLNIWILYIVKN